MARILIVDDSTVQRTILTKYLEREQHEVVGEVSNGHETLQAYQKLTPDIVLLDIVMPDSNGISILSELLQFDKNANVIMCSSTALQNVIIESIQIGAKGFLVKPLTRDALARSINKVMEMSQKQALKRQRI